MVQPLLYWEFFSLIGWKQEQVTVSKWISPNLKIGSNHFCEGKSYQEMLELIFFCGDSGSCGGIRLTYYP